MKCSICGKEINSKFGNNPYPLCVRDDTDSRCCDECNGYVVQARILSMKAEKDINKAMLGDLVVIFAVKNETYPYEILNETGKFLAGEITSIENNLIFGTWGYFAITKDDSFIIVKN